MVLYERYDYAGSSRDPKIQIPGYENEISGRNNSDLCILVKIRGASVSDGYCNSNLRGIWIFPRYLYAAVAVLHAVHVLIFYFMGTVFIDAFRYEQGFS